MSLWLHLVKGKLANLLKWPVLDLISPLRPWGIPWIALQKPRCSVSWVMQRSLGPIPGYWHRHGIDISKRRGSTSVCSCASTFVKSCHQVTETWLKNLPVITLYTSRDPCSLVHAKQHQQTDGYKQHDGFVESFNILMRAQTNWWTVSHVLRHVHAKSSWSRTLVNQSLFFLLALFQQVSAAPFELVKQDKTTDMAYSKYLAVAKGFLMIFLSR